jgi:hypothetical protein
MNEAQIAEFEFETFKFTKIEFSEENVSGKEIGIDFKTNGKYNPVDGRFQLVLETITFSTNKQETPIWKIIMVSVFRFKQPLKLEEIPAHFYANALGISFPHIRSFFASTSLQANSTIVFLPLYNLTALAEVLKANTKLV